MTCLLEPHPGQRFRRARQAYFHFHFQNIKTPSDILWVKTKAPVKGLSL
jgi:hypothetical protein